MLAAVESPMMKIVVVLSVVADTNNIIAINVNSSLIFLIFAAKLRKKLVTNEQFSKINAELS